MSCAELCLSSFLLSTLVFLAGFLVGLGFTFTLPFPSQVLTVPIANKFELSSFAKYGLTTYVYLVCLAVCKST